jgi:hypothetical protein
MGYVRIQRGKNAYSDDGYTYVDVNTQSHHDRQFRMVSNVNTTNIKITASFALQNDLQSSK